MHDIQKKLISVKSEIKEFLSKNQIKSPEPIVIAVCKTFSMDKILPLMYIIKLDFSDLIEVCQYCFDNENEIRLRGEEGREIYKKYWELNEDGSYKENMWNDIRSQFLELNMEI